MLRKKRMLNRYHMMIQKVLGDTLRVMRNTGGGGGHALTVKDFQMTIIHKRKSADGQEGRDGPYDDNQEGGEITPSRRNWVSSNPLIVQNPVRFFNKGRHQSLTLSHNMT